MSNNKSDYKNCIIINIKKITLAVGQPILAEYPQEEYHYDGKCFSPNPFHPRWRKQHDR